MFPLSQVQVMDLMSREKKSHAEVVGITKQIKPWSLGANKIRKCLLQKCKNQNLICIAHMKSSKPVRGGMYLQPQVWGLRDRVISGTHWPARLAKK